MAVLIEGAMGISHVRALQVFNDAAVLRQAASEALPDFKAFMQGTAHAYGCAYMIGPLKSEESHDRKIAASTTRNEPQKILDYCRGMLIVEDGELEKIQQIAHDMHPKRNPHVKGIKDCISVPLATGLRALYIFPEMPNGHICEVMLMSRSMKNAYDVSYETYKALQERLRESGHKILGTLNEEESRLRYKLLGINMGRVTPAYAALTLEDPA